MDAEGFESDVFHAPSSSNQNTDSPFDPFPEYDEHAERDSIANEDIEDDEGDDRGERVPWEDGDSAGSQGDATNEDETSGGSASSPDSVADAAPPASGRGETSYRYPAGADPQLNPVTLYERLFSRSLPSLTSILSSHIPHAAFRDRVDNKPIPSSDETHPFFFCPNRKLGPGYTSVGLARSISDLAAFAFDPTWSYGSIRDDKHPLGFRLVGNFRDNPRITVMENPFDQKKNKPVDDYWKLKAEVENWERVTAKHDAVSQTANDGNSTSTTNEHPDETEINAFKARGEHLCKQLKIEIIGLTPSGSIRLMCGQPRQIRSIESAARANYSAWASQIGWPLLEHVEEDDFPEVRNILLVMAGTKPLRSENELGIGVWRIFNGGIDRSQLLEDADFDDIVDDGNAREQSSTVLALINGMTIDAYDTASKTFFSINSPRIGKYTINHFESPEPWYRRRALEKHIAAAQSPSWRSQCLNELFSEFFHRWNWEKACHADLCAGLILATYVQTVFAWRPQVEIIGESHTGKTTLIDLIRCLFGPIGRKLDSVTEAAVRQILRQSARIITLDEFDQKTESGRKQQEAILKLLRSAGGGGEVARGTANQDRPVSTFTMRHIVWLLGIHSSIKDQADDNRFVFLRLLPALPGMMGKLTFDEHKAKVLGEKLLACAIVCAEEARAMAPVIRTTPIPGVPSRVVENYAVATSMLAAVQGGGIGLARRILTDVLEEVGTEANEKIDDKIELLNTIFNTLLPIRGQLVSIGTAIGHMTGELVSENTQRLDSERALSEVGIKFADFTQREVEIHESLRQSGDTECLIFHVGKLVQNLKMVEYGPKAIRSILMRCPTAISEVRRVGGRKGDRCVLIGMKWLNSEFFKEGE